jgi:hypothetical protein
MKPTKGRIVLFTKDSGAVCDAVAIITRVIDDEHVNLSVFRDNTSAPGVERHFGVPMLNNGYGWRWPDRE